MEQIVKQEKVRLIIGLIARQEFLNIAHDRLLKVFGGIDYKSEILEFDSTRYYANEMGTGLKRQFISFSNLICPEELPSIKLKTNKIEREFFSNQNNRFVNIDPGYLSLSKLVLATTKDHQHRIYLDKGIFAEVTLRYRDKTFRPWPWTYADYCKPEYIKIFNFIRNQLFTQRNKTCA
ncbi:MAG: DUF4416 family protein [Candidatus Omnitrophica bacterium]|nr:DUF4416 family protein [Candidatus Omnitrophota bacterium]